MLPPPEWGEGSDAEQSRHAFRAIATRTPNNPEASRGSSTKKRRFPFLVKSGDGKRLARLRLAARNVAFRLAPQDSFIRGRSGGGMVAPMLGNWVSADRQKQQFRCRGPHFFEGLKRSKKIAANRRYGKSCALPFPTPISTAKSTLSRL